MAPAPERILLVRTSALGDVVHCLPVLTALRRHRPRARIGWVVEQAMLPVLEGHPDLDDILVTRLRDWRRTPFRRSTLNEVAAFVGRLQDFGPDLVLDMMGNHKAGILAALTFSDRRVGLGRQYRREPSSAVWISHPVAPRGDHAVDRALSLLAALDIPPEPADFGGDKLFPEVPPDAEALLADQPDPFVLIHAGAGWPNKRYPPERWGAVAAEIRRRTGLTTWAAAGPGELELARAVEAAGGGAVRAVEAPSLPSLAALLRRCSLALGGDTGPIHLAWALGTPVLEVMGPTAPETNGPYGRPDRAIYHRLPCSFCHQRLDSTKACLDNLEPEQIAERAVNLLES